MAEASDGREPDEPGFEQSLDNYVHWLLSGLVSEKRTVELSPHCPLSGVKQTFTPQVPTLVPKPGSPTVTQEHRGKLGSE